MVRHNKILVTVKWNTVENRRTQIQFPCSRMLQVVPFSSSLLRLGLFSFWVRETFAIVLYLQVFWQHSSIIYFLLCWPPFFITVIYFLRPRSWGLGRLEVFQFCTAWLSHLHKSNFFPRSLSEYWSSCSLTSSAVYVSLVISVLPVSRFTLDNAVPITHQHVMFILVQLGYYLCLQRRVPHHHCAASLKHIVVMKGSAHEKGGSPACTQLQVL